MYIDYLLYLNTLQEIKKDTQLILFILFWFIILMIIGLFKISKEKIKKEKYINKKNNKIFSKD